MDSIADVAPRPGLAPFSLKNEPALIERVFPAQKVGIESQKERKAGAGQTLTALGSYWKGRKPLVLVRACALASLLPATDDLQGDIDLFEALMRMDPEGISRRDAKITAQRVAECGQVTEEAKARHLVRQDIYGVSAPAKWRRFEPIESAGKAERDGAKTCFDQERETIRQQTLATMSFSEQVSICERVERVENLRDPEHPLYAGVIERANARLGTNARTLPELVEQLGIARFGHPPTVGDPFAGGGSIPFEAARVGCNVVASDLNPVAAMLSWGALNIIGAADSKRSVIATDLARVAEAVDKEITRLAVEHNEEEDRAKVYLYCMETIDPKTGWRVPLLPSWVISRNRRCVAKMVPEHSKKRFNLEIIEEATDEEMARAEFGTVRDGQLVYRMAVVPGGEEEEHRVAISRLRGDGEGPELPGGGRGNLLRAWTLADVTAREPKWDAAAQPVLAGSALGAWIGGDIWLERLYCIQWMDGDEFAAGKRRPKTFFAAPNSDDIDREEKILNLVISKLDSWQEAGLVPDMPIEVGVETARLFRERGWTHWHHLFTPRHLLVMSVWRRHARTAEDVVSFASVLDRISRLSRWAVGFPGKPGVAPSADQAQNVFYNQALNTLYGHAAAVQAAYWISRGPNVQAKRFMEMAL